MENPSHYTLFGRITPEGNLKDREGRLLEAPTPAADPEIHLAWTSLIAFALACHATGAELGVEYDRAVKAYEDLCRQPRRES